MEENKPRALNAIVEFVQCSSSVHMYDLHMGRKIDRIMIYTGLMMFLLSTSTTLSHRFTIHSVQEEVKNVPADLVEIKSDSNSNIALNNTAETAHPGCRTTP